MLMTIYDWKGPRVMKYIQNLQKLNYTVSKGWKTAFKQLAVRGLKESVSIFMSSLRDIQAAFKRVLAGT